MKQLNPLELQGQIQVPKELQGAMERIVVAGKKLMYSQEVKAQFDEQFNPQNPDPMAEKLAATVFVVVGSLFGESNGTLPPQLLVPAGIFLITDLAQFVEESGIGNVEDAELGQAMELYIGYLANSMEGADQQPKQGAEPMQPATAVQPAASAGGLIKGAMQ
jgi:hypothetical protein